MLDISQWWTQNSTAKTWLVAGEDASLQKWGDFDLSEFSILALDGAIETLERADIAATLDLETVRTSGAAMDARAKFVLLPRFVRSKGQIQSKPLDAFFGDYPLLKKWDEAGRLLVCDLSKSAKSTAATSTAATSGEPVFLAGPNAAETMIGVLAQLGQQKFRTLGLDFRLRPAPLTGAAALPLERGVGEVILRHDLDLLPLGAPGPIRIFVGTDASQMVGAKVLHYSLQTHTAMTAVFDQMQDVTPPIPKKKENWSRTEFSFRRFAIPAQAGFQGRGVYLDADMQVFQDFRELWDTPFEGATILSAPSSDPKRKPQFAVMLLDCARLKWDLKEIIAGMDEGRYDYDGLMKELCIVPPEQVRPRLLVDWNSLEEYKPGQTRLIHYTEMKRQPWVSARNHNGNVWVDELVRAIDAGFVAQSEVDEAIKEGFVRPSLARQLATPRALWPMIKPAARLLDRDYKPHATIAARFAQSAPA